MFASAALLRSLPGAGVLLELHAALKPRGVVFTRTRGHNEEI